MSGSLSGARLLAPGAAGLPIDVLTNRKNDLGAAIEGSACAATLAAIGARRAQTRWTADVAVAAEGHGFWYRVPLTITFSNGKARSARSAFVAQEALYAAAPHFQLDLKGASWSFVDLGAAPQGSGMDLPLMLHAQRPYSEPELPSEPVAPEVGLLLLARSRRRPAASIPFWAHASPFLTPSIEATPSPRCWLLPRRRAPW